MAGKPGSRWANAAEDAELDAKLKREKEEKRRRKQEKIAAAEAAKAEAERQVADTDRPSKRRKLTPDPTTTNGQSTGTSEGKELPPAKLLRFERGGWGMARSVEEYDKLNDIEEGTYGWVSRATAKKTGDVVALKRLKFDGADRGGLPVTGLREIQILKDCRHRNIVELKEVVIGDNHSKLDNSIFLVLEFMEHDLKSILDDMPSPFLASEIKLLLLQLTTGLAHLHAHHILHRDLKTSNLLLNNRGVLKIADFGMARYYSPPPAAGNSDIPASQQRKLTQLVITLWYRSPELLLGTKTYGAEVDMWSVGCIFGELITREPLLQGKNEADQITQIFGLCGFPTDASWPSFRRLPNARSLRLPRTSNSSSTSQLIRAKFPSQTSATTSLLSSLLSLDPSQRPTADEVLRHDYFVKDAPKPKPESMFPTFPSKAGQERTRRKAEPHAPGRGDEAVDLGEVDFSGIFGGRDKEERGAGFTLRMV